MNSWKTSFDSSFAQNLHANFDNCVQKGTGIAVKAFNRSCAVFVVGSRYYDFCKQKGDETAKSRSMDYGNRLEQGGSFFISKGIQWNSFRTHHVLSTDCVRGYNEHLISPYEIPRVVPEYPFRMEEFMKENKIARLEMRIRPVEKERLLRAAKRSGVSVTTYVLQCCKGRAPKEKPPDSFWEVLNDLSAFGEKLPEHLRRELAQIILRLQEVA